MSNVVKVVRILVVWPKLAGGVGVFIGWMKSRDGDIQPVAVPASSNQQGHERCAGGRRRGPALPDQPTDAFDAA